MAGVSETTVGYLGDFLEASDDAVVTLVAGETRLVAHRAVLVARSPVFAAMFRGDMLEARSGQVTITDVKGPVLRGLLVYCYTLRAPRLPGAPAQMPGTAPPMLSTVRDMLVAAEKYGIDGLKGLCEEYLASALTVQNVVAAALIAMKHKCAYLLEAATKYMYAHCEVMGSVGWAHAVRNMPEELITVCGLVASRAGAPPMSVVGRPSEYFREQGWAPAAQPAPISLPPVEDDDPFDHMLRLSPAEKDLRLIQAAQEGAVDDIRHLLAAGAHAGVTDGNDISGMTALHWAAYYGHAEAARCLVDGGADVDFRTWQRETPLHCAAGRGHAAVVRLLVSRNADPSARSANGRTPLHLTVFTSRTEAAVALLEAGANKDIRDENWQSPLDFARENNRQDLVRILS